MISRASFTVPDRQSSAACAVPGDNAGSRQSIALLSSQEEKVVCTLYGEALRGLEAMMERHLLELFEVDAFSGDPTTGHAGPAIADKFD